MATLPQVSLARLIMQLIKTDQVARLQDYANVELAEAAVAVKYADAFYSFDGPQLYDGQTPPQPRDPTNEEKAKHYRKVLRKLHRDRLNAVRAIPAGTTAEQAERDIVSAEVLADLGVDD